MNKTIFDLQRFAASASVVKGGDTLTTEKTATYGKFKDETEAKAYFQRVLTKPLYEEYTLHKYCDELTHPKHKGKHIYWSTQDKFKVNLDENGNIPPLVEGVVPGEDSPANTYWHSATLSRYAGWIKYSDEVSIFSLEASVLTDMQTEQGYAVGEQFQKRLMRVMQSSKARWFAGIKPNDSAKLTDLATARQNVTKFDLEDLPRIKTYLKRNKVKPYDGKHYLMLVSPEVVEGLYSLEKSNSKYSFMDLAVLTQNNEKVYDGEIGTYMGFKLIEENAVGEVDETRYGTNKNIHGCPILGKKRGKKAISVLKLEGYSEVETILKPLGSAGTEDPVNQVGTIGWKQNGWGAFIRYDEACTIYECATDYNEIYTEIADNERSTYTESYIREGANTGAKVVDKQTKDIVNGSKKASA